MCNNEKDHLEINILKAVLPKQQYETLKREAEEVGMTLNEYHDCIVNINQCRDIVRKEDRILRKLTNGFKTLPASEDMEEFLERVKNYSDAVRRSKKIMEKVIKKRNKLNKVK